MRADAPWPNVTPRELSRERRAPARLQKAAEADLGAPGTAAEPLRTKWPRDVNAVALCRGAQLAYWSPIFCIGTIAEATIASTSQKGTIVNRHYLSIALAVFAVNLYAEVKLPALFSNGMVVQQGRDVPVWGWAAPGTAVTVKLGEASATATTPDDGKWMVRLPAVKASSDPAPMIVTVGDESKTIENVLVGEVWLCGGQSNMDFTLSGLSRSTRDPRHQPAADTIANEVKTAADPLLRQIAVPHVASTNEALADFKGAWIASAPETNGQFTGTGYFFARELRRELGVPVGLIKCPWGGTLVEPWMPPSAFESSPDMKTFYEEQHTAINDRLAQWDPEQVKARYEEQLKKWQEAVKQAKADKKRLPRRPQMPSPPNQSRTTASALFNGMIHPLIPYAVKGAIWYQGESNRRQHAKEYGLYFTQMIQGWRQLWGQGDFPFYYCQLAQFQAPSETPLDDDPWVHVCDQQRRSLALANTGMAVLNDIGEAGDIHPRNKMDAGKRLSLWALARDYGKPLTAWSGPLYRSHRIDGSKVIVTFDHVGSGLMVGNKPLLDPAQAVDEPLKRFQICGEDRAWTWAQAKIAGKDTVEVWHDEIPAPVAVRYAWAPNAEGANLYNREGLPASLFRTDDWRTEEPDGD